jgi:hypothetical protein
VTKFIIKQTLYVAFGVGFVAVMGLAALASGDGETNFGCVVIGRDCQ